MGKRGLSSSDIEPTPYTKKVSHLRWQAWEDDAETLRKRLSKDFPIYPRSEVLDFPPWILVCERAQQFERAADGEGTRTGRGQAMYGVFPGKYFSSRKVRILKKGPLLFDFAESEFGQCWLAPNEKTSKAQFSGYCSVSAREVMWMSKHPANWYTMRMIKHNFKMAASANSGKAGLRKLEISHLCHDPRCLNPNHLNLEQHGGWYSRKPIYPEDVRPGEMARLPRWGGPDLVYPLMGTHPGAAPPGGSPFEGRIELTPGGGQRVYRLPSAPCKTGIDVSVGTGSRSGNVDRTCRDYPVWIDKDGLAATPPCPHHPACIVSLNRARVRVVDSLSDDGGLAFMRKLGLVVGWASDEAKANVQLMCQDCEDPDGDPFSPAVNRRIEFDASPGV